MKIFYKTRATAAGGRSCHTALDNGSLALDLAMPGSGKTGLQIERLHGVYHSRLGGGREAGELEGLYVDFAIPNQAADFEKLGTYALAAPAFQGGHADVPAGGDFVLLEVNGFHLGFLASELAGLNEGAVSHASQGEGVCEVSLFGPIRRHRRLPATSIFRLSCGH